MSETTARIAIVGAGFAGLGMAIRLKQEGIDDFVVLERDDDVGGTWWANSYPGCQCDIPSHLYSFSFAPNPEWSHTYSGQAEIWAYLRRCAEEHGVMPHVRLGCELTAADWDDEHERWTLETSSGPVTAPIVVAGVGGLSEPSIPPIPGLEEFEGARFHSARWDHDHDLTGERVAMIGTGASAIQIVPKIQPQVGQLDVYQRTPPWVVPHSDRRITALEHALYRNVPAAQRLVRAGVYWMRESLVLGLVHDPRRLRAVELVARRHLNKQVADPELRRRLTPDYRIGCKRILPSNDWYPALTQPNVDVVTTPIREVRPRAIVSADGVEHPTDTIVFGTGFYVTDIPAARMIRGRGGRLLADVWDRSPQAYLGTTVAGFPNMFFLVGPNVGLGHNSIVYMIESQLEYVLDAVRTMDRDRVRAVEVLPEVQRSYNDELQSRMPGTVWTSGGCSSWYIDATGRNTTIWPDFTWRFRRRTRRFDPERYRLTPESEPAAPERTPAAA